MLARNAPQAEGVQADVGEFLRKDERTFELIALACPGVADHA